MSDEPAEEHEAPRAALTALAVPAVITVIGALACLFVIYRRRVDSRLPPERSGWIPWLGAAVPFGKAPLHYIKECRDEVGSPTHLLKFVSRDLFSARGHLHHTCSWQADDILV